MALENLILNEVTAMIKNDKGIEKILFDKLAKMGVSSSTRKIVISKKGWKPRELDNPHFKFEEVLQCVSAKVNLALVGPAGSGKTTIVEKVAEVFDLPFYSKSVSAQTGVHEFFGYHDANGKYVSTMFRKAYEKGGIFLLDEFDAGNPNVLASLNQASANGQCPFPDKMVPKHKDFLFVIAGNTWGTGANAEYVGRNKIDGATLDRFYFLEVPYDEQMESNLANDAEWCKKVQKFRKNAQDKKVRCIISPRATFQGEKLLMAGMPETLVAKGLIFKGLSDEEIALISTGVELSNQPKVYPKDEELSEKEVAKDDNTESQEATEKEIEDFEVID